MQLSSGKPNTEDTYYLSQASATLELKYINNLVSTLNYTLLVSRIGSDMTIEHLNNEIELTISNTEELYNLALAVTDYNTDNNQVSNLLAATFRTIKHNSSGSIDPYSIVTSLPESKELVVTIVKQLQEEAKA